MQLGVGLGLPYNLGKPAAGFSPLDLSPVLWLDASDTSTITEVAGAVSQWDDKSGNDNHVTQGTAAAQPTSGTRTVNGLNVLDFGGGDWLQVTYVSNITQPLTLFFVTSTDAPTSSNILFDSASASPRVFARTFLNDYQMNAGTSIAGGGPDTDPHIHRYVADSTSSAIFIDGLSIVSGDAGTNGMDGITIGASYNAASSHDGVFAEAIVVEGTLSAGQIAATESYLADKWGITI